MRARPSEWACISVQRRERQSCQSNDSNDMIETVIANQLLLPQLYSAGARIGVGTMTTLHDAERGCSMRRCDQTHTRAPRIASSKPRELFGACREPQMRMAEFCPIERQIGEDDSRGVLILARRARAGLQPPRLVEQNLPALIERESLVDRIRNRPAIQFEQAK